MKIPKKLNDNLAYMLHRTALNYQLLFDREMESLKLSRSQWILLAQLYFCDGINQKDLADLMELGKVAVGKLAQKLEKSGWISRIPDAEDGRAFKLTITPKAKPIVKNLVDLLVMETDYSLEGFSAREIADLRDYLVRIRKNLAQAQPSAKWRAIQQRALKDAQRFVR